MANYVYDSTVFPTPFMWLLMLYGKLFVRQSGYQLGQISAAFSPPTGRRAPSSRDHPRSVEPELLARFDFDYLPPHPLDRENAHKVLRCANHLAFSIWDEEGALIGYTLLRLSFPWRAATGVWTLAADPERGVHSRGLSRAAVRSTAEVTRQAGLADSVTVLLEDVPSLRGAQWAGWRIVRTNRRFHVPTHRYSFGDDS